MAINYNLSKVYALSHNDPEFVMQVITLFVDEVPHDIQLPMKKSFKLKIGPKVKERRKKLKPLLIALKVK